MRLSHTVMIPDKAWSLRKLFSILEWEGHAFLDTPKTLEMGPSDLRQMMRKKMMYADLEVRDFQV